MKGLSVISKSSRIFNEASAAMIDRLDSLMLLYFEADIAMDLNLDGLVDNWAKIR